MKTAGALLFAIAMVASMGAAASEQSKADLRQQGRALFNASCVYCHGERGFATRLLAKRIGKDQAQLEQRTDLQPALIRHVVRHGINSMPWYRRAELSDAELNAIIVYLTAPKTR